MNESKEENYQWTKKKDECDVNESEPTIFRNNSSDVSTEINGNSTKTWKNIPK